VLAVTGVRDFERAVQFTVDLYSFVHYSLSQISEQDTPQSDGFSVPSEIPYSLLLPMY